MTISDSAGRGGSSLAYCAHPLPRPDLGGGEKGRSLGYGTRSPLTRPRSGKGVCHLVRVPSPQTGPAQTGPGTGHTLPPPLRPLGIESQTPVKTLPSLALRTWSVHIYIFVSNFTTLIATSLSKEVTADGMICSENIQFLILTYVCFSCWFLWREAGVVVRHNLPQISVCYRWVQ